MKAKRPAGWCEMTLIVCEEMSPRRHGDACGTMYKPKTV
jgi:hypothetical protein